MAKVSFVTANSETGFLRFVRVIRHKEMNPNQDARQTSIKMLWKN